MFLVADICPVLSFQCRGPPAVWKLTARPYDSLAAQVQWTEQVENDLEWQSRPRRKTARPCTPRSIGGAVEWSSAEGRLRCLGRVLESISGRLWRRSPSTPPGSVISRPNARSIGTLSVPTGLGTHRLHETTAESTGHGSGRRRATTVRELLIIVAGGGRWLGSPHGIQSVALASCALVNET